MLHKHYASARMHVTVLGQYVHGWGNVEMKVFHRIVFEQSG